MASNVQAARPAHRTAEASRHRGGLEVVPALAVAFGLVILLALGVWQVQRLQWKEALLARIAALQSAPPEPLGVVLNRLPTPGEPARGEVDFVRVQTVCPTLQQTPSLHLYAILDGVMGYRLISACPITAGPFRSLLVDRGFVADERVGQVRTGPPITAPVVGVLRKVDGVSWLSPPNTPARNIWHSRNVAAMASALAAPSPAPVFLMLESPRPPDPGPQGAAPAPAAIPTDIPNNHLGYALTWFGLAIGLVCVYASSLIRRRRERPEA